MLKSFSNFKITSTTDGSDNFQSITLAIQPNGTDMKNLQLTLLVDVTEDIKVESKLEEKRPLMLSICDDLDQPILPQNVSFPPLLRRQIAVCEFEPPGMNSRDKIGAWKNYVHYLVNMLDNLTTYLQASNQSNIPIEITLAFTKMIDDTTFCYTPTKNQKLTHRSSPHILSHHLYRILSTDTKDTALEHKMFPYQDISTMIHDRFKDKQNLFIISQRDMKNLRLQYHRYHTNQPLSTYIVNDFLDKMIKFVDVDVVMNIKSDPELVVTASDDYVLDSREEVSLSIKKRMRANEVIYVEIRPLEGKLNNINIDLAVFCNKRTIQKQMITEKTLKVDYWLTSMVQYLLECQKSLKKMEYETIERKIITASTLNMGISGTDLSLITRYGTWKGLESKVINDILNVKGKAILTLCEMAKIIKDRNHF